MKQIRAWCGYALLSLSRIALRLHVGYVAWLLFRWSLIVYPVDAESRQAAVEWWDLQGWLWGFRRYPKQTKENK